MGPLKLHYAMFLSVLVPHVSHTRLWRIPRFVSLVLVLSLVCDVCGYG